MMNKKGIAPLILIAAAIIGLIILAGSVTIPRLDTASFTGSGQYIERPVFKFVKCEETSDIKFSAFTPIATSGEWLNKPSVSSSYNVNIQVISAPTTLGAAYIEYSVCNSQVNSAANCPRIYNQRFGNPTAGNGVKTGQTFQINNVGQREYVFVSYKKYLLFQTSNIGGLQSQIGWVPYGLRTYDVLSGSNAQLNPNDCTVPANDDSWKDRFIRSDSSKVPSAVSTTVNERTLQPEEVRWYVSGYLTSAAPSFALKYKNQDAWCRTTGTAAEIYKINTITVGSGTYKVASPDYSDYLGSERCCPGQTQGDQVCQSDFTWKQIGGSECSSFKSCGSPNWVPYSDAQLIKYSCVNGYCKSQTKNVECANDADCSDSNKVCDLNVYKCVNANVNLDGQIIETAPDNIADCAKIGGTWRSEKSEKKKIWNYVGIGDPEVVLNEYCDTGSAWGWVSTLVFVIVLVLILIAVIKYVPAIRGLLKGIPILGRFIP